MRATSTEVGVVPESQTKHYFEPSVEFFGQHDCKVVQIPCRDMKGSMPSMWALPVITSSSAVKASQARRRSGIPCRAIWPSAWS